MTGHPDFDPEQATLELAGLMQGLREQVALSTQRNEQHASQIETMKTARATWEKVTAEFERQAAEDLATLRRATEKATSAAERLTAQAEQAARLNERSEAALKLMQEAIQASL
ncbi:MAG: hypothetical protein JSU06_19705 [Actinobacteria bacterium]|nr:hypothetical protein [Actinomycetota bacterium]